uniref:Uncharacterized protein n=1 Tax=Aegilops tauschii subsp. strangulata TaxID=200361 RepID=A0A453G6P0_AEGTS
AVLRPSCFLGSTVARWELRGCSAAEHEAFAFSHLRCRTGRRAGRGGCQGEERLGDPLVRRAREENGG